MPIKDRLLELAHTVRGAVRSYARTPIRTISDDRDGGDPHFEIDELAEQTTRAVLDRWDIPVAYVSEDRGIVHLAPDPELLLVIDPIDGTRPAMGGFESCCFSVVAVPYSADARLGQTSHALILELGTGEHFYADAQVPGIEASGGPPRLSPLTDLERMFWSIELTAHPVQRLIDVYGHLIDGSVTTGAVFVFTSASYSLTRLVTGQLDAHVDVGHRILCDLPETLAEFERVGRGKVATLFPYDIAAAAFIAERAGATVTDAYGASLADLRLVTDKSIAGQCSLVAAANPALHAKVMEQLRWPVAAGGGR